jgi:beta-glucosidase
MAVAMVRGFQGNNLADAGSIAACAKHFAAYGAVESGRDYATTNISEYELRNYYLRPFKAAIDAGVSTLMASFSDVNGVPATGNEFLMRKVLREEWAFEGFVVSDWDSVRQLIIHGLSEDDRDAALAAVTAGVNMEMVGQSYIHHLPALVEEGLVAEAMIDELVASILRVKFQLGLFENAYTNPSDLPPAGNPQALDTVRQAALQSVVLLKNEGRLLPLSPDKLNSVALIGPLADAPYEQLGTWIFDGNAQWSVTPRRALEERLDGQVEVHYVRAMDTSRSRVSPTFDDAVRAASEADVAILFLGEESILSGEAHSRANIDLPGDQAELVRRIRATGRPVIAVIQAGRALTLTNIVDEVDALLFAWHPGTMGGPAIADLLLGVDSPSGKLPVTFPRMVGQIPIYYNQKNTGKPPSHDTIVHIDDIDPFAPQTSLGMTAFHLDAGYTPLFPFGFGLSYGEFHYDNMRVATPEVPLGESLRASVELTNRGAVAAEEVVQLYVRDLVGNVTRPIKELKGFRRVRLAPGETTVVEFVVHTDELAFYDRHMRRVTEPGKFHVWIGGDSDTQLRADFRVVDILTDDQKP